jgi:hypothetical protein
MQKTEMTSFIGIKFNGHDSVLHSQLNIKSAPVQDGNHMPSITTQLKKLMKLLL